MAVKATWGQVNGEARNIQKDPKTGDGMKKSATGLLRVEKVDGDYRLFDRQTEADEIHGQLNEVFCNGKQLTFQTFAQIVERLKAE